MDGTLNAAEKWINRALADAKVPTISRAAASPEAGSALAKHMRMRRTNHQSAMLQWFNARSDALYQTRLRAPAKWAYLMLANPQSEMPTFDAFLREQLQGALGMIRPMYRAVISSVEMAGVVRKPLAFLGH